MLENKIFIFKYTPVDAADSSSVTLHKINWQGEKEELVIKLDVLQFTTYPPGGAEGPQILLISFNFRKTRTHFYKVPSLDHKVFYHPAI